MHGTSSGRLVVKLLALLVLFLVLSGCGLLERQPRVLLVPQGPVAPPAVCLQQTEPLPDILVDGWDTAQAYLEWGADSALKHEHCRRQLMDQYKQHVDNPDKDERH